MPRRVIVDDHRDFIYPAQESSGTCKHSRPSPIFCRSLNSAPPSVDILFTFYAKDVALFGGSTFMDKGSS